jgi:hypothetical protein
VIGTTPFSPETENDATSHLRIRKLEAKYHEKIKTRNVIFKVGDKVRIVKLNNTFSRGYNEIHNTLSCRPGRNLANFIDPETNFKSHSKASYKI